MVRGLPRGRGALRIVLAAIGGALEFIPVVGRLSAGVAPTPGCSSCFLLVWRGIQDYAASPLIMGRGIDIHPALVIIGVLAGGEIAGVVGMFLSVPVIAAVRIVWRRLYTPDITPVQAAIESARAAGGSLPPPASASSPSCSHGGASSESCRTR